MNSRRIPEEIKLTAFYARDPAFAGLFYAAVKTTGIFCRVGCPARAPRPENVQFFESVKEALEAGFRPCKVCKPLIGVGEASNEVKSLIDELHKHPELRITDRDLEQRGIQPDTIRRWFKKHHGITFQAYQRYLKIGNALEQLKSGERVSAVAFESYDSLSGFQDSFKHAIGLSPRDSVGQTVIYLTRIPTPLGLMIAGAVDGKLCLLEFSDRKVLPAELDQLQHLCNGVLMPSHVPLFDELHRQLEDYFSGRLRHFTVPLRLLGTPFQLRVWNALLEIPFGTTRSYAEQAAAIGQPTAVRAVAHTNGMNRIAIVVPCHRVIGSDGGLTGYGGGLERKNWLLSHEAGVLSRDHAPLQSALAAK